MTITEAIQPVPLSDADEYRAPSTPLPALTKYAPRLAIAAGAVMAGAQLVVMQYDPKDHIRTSQNVVFQAGNIAYLAGFYLLLAALIGMYQWQRDRLGRRGTAAAVAAGVGTLLLGGDLWFETFATPWLADTTPGAFDTDPTVMLGLGAIASYVTFAIGWLSFGIASYKARVLPRGLCIAMAVGGVIGYNALIAPFGVPLAVAVAGVGIWMGQARRAR